VGCVGGRGGGGGEGVHGCGGGTGGEGDVVHCHGGGRGQVVLLRVVFGCLRKTEASVEEENRGRDGGFYSAPGQRRGAIFWKSFVSVRVTCTVASVRRCYLTVYLDVILEISFHIDCEHFIVFGAFLLPFISVINFMIVWICSLLFWVINSMILCGYADMNV
jgi:hypothetical protein